MDREELLKREHAAWLGFVDVVAAVPPDRRGVEGVVPGWSVHDLVWHVAFWAGWAGEVLERIRRGEPDPGDPADTEAEILRVGRGIGWDEVVGRAEQGREQARAALSSFGDLPQSAEERFTDETFDHYQEHAAQIRAFSA